GADIDTVCAGRRPARRSRKGAPIRIRRRTIGDRCLWHGERRVSQDERRKAFDSPSADWHAGASRTTAVEETEQALAASAAPKVYRPGNSQAKGLQRFGTLERNVVRTERTGRARFAEGNRWRGSRPRR